MKEEERITKPVTLEDIIKYWKLLVYGMTHSDECDKAVYYYCEGIEFCITSLQDWLKQQY